MMSYRFSTTTRKLTLTAFCTFILFLATLGSKDFPRTFTGFVWLGFFSGAMAAAVRDIEQQMEKDDIEQVRQTA